MDAQQRSQQLLRRIASPQGLDVLFEYLPDVYFFVKDADGRFARANQAFVKLVGVESEHAVLGQVDADFFPRNMAESYARDDAQVLASREALVDKAELVQNPDGTIDWFCTTKLPLLDASGAAIGVAGITRDVKKMSSHDARFLSWAPVLETMLSDYAGPLDSKDLAKKLSLSVSQFNRQFRKRFHTTARAYLTNVRLNAACHFLVSSDLTMAEIAIRTGFYDQSHFTNHFARCYGMPPSKYRAQYASQRAASDELVASVRAPASVAQRAHGSAGQRAPGAVQRAP